jgi:predicted dehydrogenase
LLDHRDNSVVTKPIRVAVIGYGLSGAVFHVPLVTSTPEMELVSVVTGDPGRQARVRVAVPGVRVVDNTDQLWAAGADHDLVVIATPTGTHLAVGLAAIEAGLPMVVDKPMATTAADSRTLATAAAARGLWLSVFHNRRWDGETLTIQRLLSDRALGAVTRFESRFERWRPEPHPAAWRDRTGTEDGGGILLDLGSHLVDQATYLFGRPLSVYAEVERRRPGGQGDDDVFIALEHADAVRSHLWASAVAANLGPSVRVLGLAGAYVKEGLDIQEEGLRSGARPGRPDWGREAPDLWGRLWTGGDSGPVETVPGDWPAYYVGVVESLRSGTPPPVTADDGIAVLEVLDAARESARRRQVIAIPSVSIASANPADT